MIMLSCITKIKLELMAYEAMFATICYSAHAMKILNEKWIPKLPCGNIARDGKPRNSGPVWFP
jgi:hypothetical protein